MLIEEARTNVALNSGTLSNFTNGAGFTNKASADIAPDGSQNAVALTEDTTSGGHTNQYNLPGTYNANTAYTYSIYVKKYSYNTHLIQLYDLSNNCGALITFNISTGTVSATSTSGSNFTSVSSAITPVGNGWYRCSVTATITLASTFMLLQNYLNTAGSYLGNGWNATLLWGAQLEAGAFPTSYIPTVASQVTRALDNAQITGANLNGFYNIAQGSWFASYTAKATSIFPRIVGMNSGKTPLYYTASSLVAGLYDGGAAIATANGATSNSIAKMSSSWVGTTGALCLNGGSVATGNQPNGYSTITFVSIGSDQAGSQFLNSTIQKISYYPIALSNAELQEMTS